jgi:dTDP-4-amino-4,6-dideoxy-D-galactose acyltransferase
MSLVEQLDWDSEFFGFPIGRVRNDVNDSHVAAAVREANARKLRCVYLCVTAKNERLLDEAQRLGFMVRDVRVTLQGRVPNSSVEHIEVKPAGLAAFDGLAAIARERFQATRFFADPGFDRDRCRELYVAWLRRGLQPSPDRVTLVAEKSRGFVVCRFDRPTNRGEIELIGVAKEADGQGIGSALVNGAQATFTREGLTYMRVVTQGSNIAAQRLYQRHGFHIHGVALWLHRWH